MILLSCMTAVRHVKLSENNNVALCTPKAAFINDPDTVSHFTTSFSNDMMTMMGKGKDNKLIPAPYTL